MKKVIRTVWISILTGLAFLVACTSPKGLSRAEKKQLKEERAELVRQIDDQTIASSKDPEELLSIRRAEMDLRLRLNEIDHLLGIEESAENTESIHRVNAEIDSIREVIKNIQEPEPCVYGPPIDDDPEPDITDSLRITRRELLNRYNEIAKDVKRREGACVYGSPEVMERYKNETSRLRRQMAEIKLQIKDIDNQIGEDDKQ